jgi:hypothetical protein
LAAATNWRTAPSVFHRPLHRAEDIGYAISCSTSVGKLRDLSPLWDMHRAGIDLNTVQWAAR